MDSVWVAHEDVFSSRVGDDLALMNQGTSRYFTMNKTGAIIWEVLQKPATETEIIQAVSEGFDVDTAQCEQDVRAFLSRMHDAQLIKKG